MVSAGVRRCRLHAQICLSGRAGDRPCPSLLLPVLLRAAELLRLVLENFSHDELVGTLRLIAAAELEGELVRSAPDQ